MMYEQPEHSLFSSLRVQENRVPFAIHNRSKEVVPAGWQFCGHLPDKRTTRATPPQASFLVGANHHGGHPSGAATFYNDNSIKKHNKLRKNHL
jgi:hypothetical protein